MKKTRPNKIECSIKGETPQNYPEIVEKAITRVRNEFPAITPITFKTVLVTGSECVKLNFIVDGVHNERRYDPSTL